MSATPRPWTVNGFGGKFRVLGRLSGVALSAFAEPGDPIDDARLIVTAVNSYEAHQRAAEALRVVVEDAERAANPASRLFNYEEARAALAELDRVQR